MSKTSALWFARLASLATLFIFMFLPLGIFIVAADDPKEASYATTMTLLILGCGLGAGGAYLSFALVLSKLGRLGPDEIIKEWRQGT